MSRATQLELLDTLDRSAFSAAELAGNLADIARLNRLTGTTTRVCRAVLCLIPSGARQVTILDVGTGAADVPVAIQRAAIRRGLSVQIVAADWHPGVLCSLQGSIAAIRADALRLPVSNGGVDVLICSQMLHHLTPQQVIVALQEFSRVARFGFVLFDLERSRLAVRAARLLTWAISRNRLTRYDGPLSVRRAYRRDEIRELVAQAGLAMTALTISAAFPFRWLGVYRQVFNKGIR